MRGIQRSKKSYTVSVEQGETMAPTFDRVHEEIAGVVGLNSIALVAGAEAVFVSAIPKGAVWTGREA